MKFNKLAIVASFMFQFGILNCMQAEDIEFDKEQQQIEHQESVDLNEHGPVPALLDTIILLLTKQASEIHDKDGYDVMDEYIKNIATRTSIQEMYGKIISCMTKNFNRPDVFAIRLINLYVNGYGATTMELFCNLDNQAKVSVVECLMYILYDSDIVWRTHICQLLNFIFRWYCDICFYIKFWA